MTAFQPSPLPGPKAGAPRAAELATVAPAELR